MRSRIGVIRRQAIRFSESNIVNGTVVSAQRDIVHNPRSVRVQYKGVYKIIDASGRNLHERQRITLGLPHGDRGSAIVLATSPVHIAPGNVVL